LTAGFSVSVIICSYNGASRVRSTLEALAKCKVDFPVEIILVDNESNDGTADVARQVWDEVGNPNFVFRALREPQLGLTFARRRGVRAARGDLIVFCDDDNWLASDYLKVAVEVMRNPAIGAVGGQCEPVIEGTVPNFLYSHGGGYALGIQAVTPGDVTESRGYLWGAGLTARRGDLLTLYDCPGFPVLLDRRERQLSAGGDSEICAGLILLDRRLVYDDRLYLRHFVPAYRLTSDYLLQLVTGFGDSHERLWYYAVLRDLRSHSCIGNVARNGLRWLRWMADDTRKQRYRFAFLGAARLPAAMTETERVYYRIYRHLLSKTRLRAHAAG